MLDIIYRYDPDHPSLREPRTPSEAKKLLERGNRDFAHLLDSNYRMEEGQRVIPFDLSGLGLDGSGDVPTQRPFAAVLGCADARVPIEMIFNQGSNSLFVVRVAGNVLGSECEGSLDYAAENFSATMKVIVVLGHTRCGAVSAAVDSFLDPAKYLHVSQHDNLRIILDRLFISVRVSGMALDRVHGPKIKAKAGYRDALVEMTVVVNAALAAHTIAKDLATPGRRLLYGVYDLGSRLVRLPLAAPGEDPLQDAGLFDPPSGEKEFEALADKLANSNRVRHMLRLPATT